MSDTLRDRALQEQWDYINVVKWLDKRGALPQLQAAHYHRLSQRQATRLVREVLGARTKVQWKPKSYGSYAHYRRNTGREMLSFGMAMSGTLVRLSLVLHECAHILDYRKGSKLGQSRHGEPFKRSYERLLREYHDLNTTFWTV